MFVISPLTHRVIKKFYPCNIPLVVAMSRDVYVGVCHYKLVLMIRQAVYITLTQQVVRK
jgi:hypothetical protein